jgi:hypothetical protein
MRSSTEPHRTKFSQEFRFATNRPASIDSTLGPLTRFNMERYVAQDNSEMFWPSQKGGVFTV